MHRDERLGPQAPQDLNLLLQATAPPLEGNTKRLVLDPVPAGAHAEAQPALREQRHLHGLLGHQRGLPLRYHQHTDDQFHPMGHTGEVPEQHERLMERFVLLRVRTRQWRIAVGVLGAEHVVVCDEVVEAEFFGPLGIVPDCHGV